MLPVLKLVKCEAYEEKIKAARPAVNNEIIHLQTRHFRRELRVTLDHNGQGPKDAVKKQ